MNTFEDTSVTQRVERRLSVAVLNQHLVCALCSGYLIDATAIVDCLHRFCRSCIVSHLKYNRFCPICETQITDGRQWDCLRPDEIIQNLVYKCVPGLYKREMCARSEFYADREVEPPEGEAGGKDAYRFFSQEDGISMSLECYRKTNSIPNLYLKGPAAVSVRHIKKFLRIKFELPANVQIDIYYDDECLPDAFSLMDIAYTFNWDRLAPLKLTFRFYTRLEPKMKPKSTVVTSEKTTQSATVDPQHQQKQNEYLGNLNLNPRGQVQTNGQRQPRLDESDDSTNSELQIASDKDSEDEYHPRGKKRRKHDSKSYQMKRRKSDSFADNVKMKEIKNRRKSSYDSQIVTEIESGTLKNEALKKVFILKDKPETIIKKKKRKKSKHHEPEMKKRKPEMVSPSIMSIGKDPLKLKVKLAPNIPKEQPEELHKIDKERLLHLRSVRHKAITSSPSLTISKVDYSEQANKTSLVESKPSLEIMLVHKKDEKIEKAKPETITEKNKSTQQSILQIAETLVNRKLSPKIPNNNSTETAVSAMRDLKTLSDAAVNILMAAKSDPPLIDNTQLKIPVYPRERPTIPPIPQLHEIYPKRRPNILQNQSVRHIPDPSSVILNRHNSYLQHNRPDSSTTTTTKSIPPLIKAKLPLPQNSKPISSNSLKMPNPVRRMDMTKIETVAAGLTARANAMIDAK